MLTTYLVRAQWAATGKTIRINARSTEELAEKVGRNIQLRGCVSWSIADFYPTPKSRSEREKRNHLYRPYSWETRPGKITMKFASGRVVVFHPAA